MIEGPNVDHAGLFNALLNSAREVCRNSTEKKTGKRMVAIGKDRAWQDWSESLQLSEGRAKMFKIAKQMRKEEGYCRIEICKR